MPSRFYRRTGIVYNASVTYEHLNYSWSRSPRVNGELQLRANPVTREKSKLTDLSVESRGTWSYVTGSPRNPATVPGVAQAMLRLESETYARLRGKLYKGSAALGITAAEMRNSREMIVKRYTQLSGFAGDMNKRIYLLEKRRQLRAKHIADAILEVKFGWTPLLTDIHNSCMTVIQRAADTAWVSASAETKVVNLTRVIDSSIGRAFRHDSVSVRANRSAGVRVDNPNRWLAERAGILNPVAVAWDLVPWSFVVNMFTNIGQLVGSITDFSGLTFVNSSITKGYKGVHTDTSTMKSASGYCIFETDFKYRSLGGVAPPRELIFRFPEVDWNLAVTAASLFTQRFRFVSSILSTKIR